MALLVVVWGDLSYAEAASELGVPGVRAIPGEPGAAGSEARWRGPACWPPRR